MGLSRVVSVIAAAAIGKATAVPKFARPTGGGESPLRTRLGGRVRGPAPIGLTHGIRTDSCAGGFSGLESPEMMAFLPQPRRRHEKVMGET